MADKPPWTRPDPQYICSAVTVQKQDLQDLLELTPQKDVLFIIGDWNAKVGSQETPGLTGNLALECGMKQCKD